MMQKGTWEIILSKIKVGIIDIKKKFKKSSKLKYYRRFFLFIPNSKDE